MTLSTAPLPPREPIERAARRGGGSPWTQFLLKRGIGLLLTFAVLVVITFLIVPLIPGDPAVQAAGPDASPAKIEQVRSDLGLDEPMAQRFADYVGGVLRGDLGESFALSASVRDVIVTRLPFTATLAVAAIAMVLLVSIPVGMAVSILTRGGRRRWLDHGFSGATGFFGSIPPYVTATLFVVVFAVTLSWLPPAYSARQGWTSFILPVAALALGPICTVSRVVRRETDRVVVQDYMRTARGWRIGSWRRYALYALPNLLTSTLTLAGLLLTSMLGGAIIVETVFNWPGLGLAVVQAIVEKDYPLIQGSVLVIGMLAAILTMVIDALLGAIDPRTLGAKNVA